VSVKAPSREDNGRTPVVPQHDRSRLPLDSCLCIDGRGDVIAASRHQRQVTRHRYGDSLEQVQDRLALLLFETDDSAGELFVDEEGFGAGDRVRSHLSV
jgi:hypothetical protein